MPARMRNDFGIAHAAARRAGRPAGARAKGRRREPGPGAAGRAFGRAQGPGAGLAGAGTADARHSAALAALRARNRAPPCARPPRTRACRGGAAAAREPIPGRWWQLAANVTPRYEVGP